MVDPALYWYVLALDAWLLWLSVWGWLVFA